MNRKELSKVSKGKKYIRFKATGKMIIQAKTKEEAIEKAKERFEDYLEEVDEDSSFPRTGLSQWLTEEVEMLLGLEEPIETELREGDEEMEIRWTNYMTEGRKDIYPKGKVLREKEKDED